MRNVCILGASLNTGNMGVSALAASLVKLIKEAEPDARISFFLGARTTAPQEVQLAGRREKIEIINYRLSPRAKIKEHLATLFFLAILYRVIPFTSWKKVIIESNSRIRSLEQADFVGNISGGDSFSDIYGLGRFITGAIVSLIVILIGKKLCLLPQTYGPYRSTISQHLARYILKKSDTILARDRESLEFVRQIIDSKESHKFRSIEFCPDVAFALEAKVADQKAIHPPLDGASRRPVVGLNVNGLMYNGGYTRKNMFGLVLNYRRFVHEGAQMLLKKTNCSLLLVPHTFAPEGDVESDTQACKEVLESLSEYKGRVHMLRGEHDQHAVKGIIGLCSFFIGSRMHACIAALSQGIPTVAVAYSGKFKGVFDSAGAGQMVIDARETGLEEAEERLLSLYGQADAVKPVLRERAGQMRTQLSDTFRSLIRKGSA